MIRLLSAVSLLVVFGLSAFLSDLLDRFAAERGPGR